MNTRSASSVPYRDGGSEPAAVSRAASGAAARSAHRLIDRTMADPRSAASVTTGGSSAVSAEPSARPHDAEAQLGLAATPLRALLRREPVAVAPTTSIRETAALMRQNRVASVLVVEDDRLLGIVTDRDMRNRAIADGLDTSRPITDIATAAPLTADLRATAFDALLLMARRNIHHVPVMDGTRIAGMITATDLTRQHTTSAVFLAGDIHKQDSIEGLQQASARIRDLQRALAAADASAHATGHVITAVTDALTSRLLHLAEAQFGPPPVDYAWVAAGSQARCEQTAKSDQDNCMVLDDAYDEARHGEYFRALSKFVCDGLNACGYVYCPGEMMAMTDAWRQPQRRWKKYFHQWIDEPEPKALMLTCVFFDLRLVHGRAALLEELRSDMLRHTKGNSIFLAYMVSNALSRRPPLNVFGQIAPARSGAQRGKIDLKHLGIVPIVDLARVYALAGGQPAVNTDDRLEVAAQGGEVSEQGARDLRDALEFLAVTRIRNQVRQIEAGQPVDSFLSLGELSNFQRTQLKDAFVVVQSLQEVIGQRHQAGRF
jgi:CBS domain-containing protein